MMGLYITYLVAGLLNTYLLLFLAGATAGPTLIPGLAIIAAILLFATSGFSLFRRKIAAWVGIAFLAPILLWQSMVIWEQRNSLGELSHLLFSVPFLCTLVAIVVSLSVVYQSLSTSDRPNSMHLSLRVVLSLVPVSLAVAYVVWLSGHLTIR